MAAEVTERSFPVMGSTAHVVVVGDPALLEVARDRLHDLEARWSRFRPSSELCGLNAAGGQWFRVSPPTFALVVRAVHAWELTGGLFDPTVLPALETAGYIGNFDARAPLPSPAAQTPQPVPGCAGIELAQDRIRLPRGVRIDLGGIGKGFAADMVAAELMAAGAHGACVNVGGDLRVSGIGPGTGAWVIGVADEAAPQADLVQVGLAEGAVATSTRLRRRWHQDGQQCHHLIDPVTGTSTTNEVDTVTVIAGEASWAEVLAKAALIAGTAAGIGLLEKWEVAGLIVTDDATEHRVGGWKGFQR